MTVPSSSQVAPFSAPSILVRVTAFPPVTGTFLNVLTAPEAADPCSKRIHCPSGEKLGFLPNSVPETTRDVTSSIVRNIRTRAAPEAAPYTMRRPSGEIATTGLQQADANR